MNNITIKHAEELIHELNTKPICKIEDNRIMYLYCQMRDIWSNDLFKDTDKKYIHEIACNNWFNIESEIQDRLHVGRRMREKFHGASNKELLTEISTRLQFGDWGQWKDYEKQRKERAKLLQRENYYFFHDIDSDTFFSGTSDWCVKTITEWKIGKDEWSYTIIGIPESDYKHCKEKGKIKKDISESNEK